MSVKSSLMKMSLAKSVDIVHLYASMNFMGIYDKCSVSHTDVIFILIFSVFQIHVRSAIFSMTHNVQSSYLFFFSP